MSGRKSTARRRLTRDQHNELLQVLANYKQLVGVVCDVGGRWDAGIAPAIRAELMGECGKHVEFLVDIGEWK